MMWSAAYRENLRFTYDDIIASILPRLRSRLHCETYPSQAARRTFTTLKVGAGARRNGAHSTECRSDSETASRWKARQCAIGGILPKCGSPVGRKFDSLIFLHAACGDVG